MNKKGMEMWELVLMILAIILLIFLVAWYAGLNTMINEMLTKISRLW